MSVSSGVSMQVLPEEPFTHCALAQSEACVHVWALRGNLRFIASAMPVSDEASGASSMRQAPFAAIAFSRIWSICEATRGLLSATPEA